MFSKILGLSYRILVASWVIHPIIWYIIPIQKSDQLSGILVNLITLVFSLFISHYFFSKVVKDNRGQLLGIFY